MVDLKDIEQRYGKIEWFHLQDGDQMFWGAVHGVTGIAIFSFDGGKTAHSAYGYGKNELTPEQIEIFKKENPVMSKFYLYGKRYTPQSVMDEATSMGYADATYYGDQDGITYYKLVPKEVAIMNGATLFLAQDKDGRILITPSSIVYNLFPNRE